jgi:hypothetical protein
LLFINANENDILHQLWQHRWHKHSLNVLSTLKQTGSEKLLQALKIKKKLLQDEVFLQTKTDIFVICHAKLQGTSKD